MISVLFVKVFYAKSAFSILAQLSKLGSVSSALFHKIQNTIENEYLIQNCYRWSRRYYLHRLKIGHPYYFAAD